LRQSLLNRREKKRSAETPVPVLEVKREDREKKPTS